MCRWPIPPQMNWYAVGCLRQIELIRRCVVRGNASNHALYATGSSVGGFGKPSLRDGGGGGGGLLSSSASSEITGGLIGATAGAASTLTATGLGVSGAGFA